VRRFAAVAVRFFAAAEVRRFAVVVARFFEAAVVRCFALLGLRRFAVAEVRRLVLVLVAMNRLLYGVRGVSYQPTRSKPRCTRKQTLITNALLSAQELLIINGKRLAYICESVIGIHQL